MTRVRTSRTGCRAGRAFTLVEAAMSIVIVGLMLVAAVNTLGASRAGQYKMGLRQKAELLGQALMAEIMSLSYADPDQTPTFGPETGESGTTRAAFDDVDDYNNWVDDPVKAKDGTALTDGQGWRRTVAVAYVALNDLRGTSPTDTGAKRITVTVYYNGAKTAEVVAVRTSAR